MFPIDRRRFLGASAPWLLAMSAGIRSAMAQNDAGLTFGPPHPFSFDWLRQRARELATAAYGSPQPPAERIVQHIDFDAIQKIRFRRQCALWHDQPLPVGFFHLNEFVPLPVTIHAVQDGQARQILYSKSCFDYQDPALASQLPDDLGFSPASAS